MRKSLVAGNWKMHGSLTANRQLLADLVKALNGRVAANYSVCAPFPYLSQVAEMLAGSSITWGAQEIGRAHV